MTSNLIDGSRSAPRVIVVAALPPPVAGQSLAGEMLVNALRDARIRHEVVDLARELASPGLAALVRRALRVLLMTREVARCGRRLGAGWTVLYVQLGLSPRGMLRDLPLLWLARRRGWPVVAHVHGQCYDEALGRAPGLLAWAARRALAGVWRVVVLSPALREPFASIAGPGRVVTIANGVPGDIVADAAAAPQRQRGGAPLKALYLANLIPTKGYEVVLEAAAASQAAGLGDEFVLAGQRTGATRIDPEEFARARGLRNVRYVGPVFGPAKLALLREADVLLLPSYGEGQPLVILEALHYGLPVIGTRTGGIPDIVRDGVDGLLIDRPDPKALLAGLQRIATEPGLYEALSTSSRAVAAEYTAEKHGRAMVELLCTAPAPHGSGHETT